MYTYNRLLHSISFLMFQTLWNVHPVATMTQRGVWIPLPYRLKVLAAQKVNVHYKRSVNRALITSTSITSGDGMPPNM